MHSWNDACMDADRMNGRNDPQPTSPTLAEKDQRKALLMKAVRRSHARRLEVVGCERLRPIAPSRQNLSTQDARQSGFLNESREAIDSGRSLARSAFSWANRSIWSSKYGARRERRLSEILTADQPKQADSGSDGQRTNFLTSALNACGTSRCGRWPACGSTTRRAPAIPASIAPM
jgi:hypothetical protein